MYFCFADLQQMGLPYLRKSCRTLVNQLADILTKALNDADHEKAVKALGICMTVE